MPDLPARDQAFEKRRSRVDLPTCSLPTVGHAGDTPHDARAIPRPFGARLALAHGVEAVFELLPGARQRSALLLHETTQDAHPADDCQKGRPRSLGQSAQERRVAHATVPDDAHLVRPKRATQVPYLCRHRGAILIAREALVQNATHPVSSSSQGTLKISQANHRLHHLSNSMARLHLASLVRQSPN